MKVFRRVQQSDLPAILHFAEKGGYGLTSLPADGDLLAGKIARAVASFEQTITVPENEFYLFVIEDVATGTILGCSGIEAQLNYHDPFYSYKLSTLVQVNHSLNVYKRMQILSLVNDYQGNSELCSLFLDSAYRNLHLSRLLSFARLLFIAEFPQRFADDIVAEMRGISDDTGHSPFWEHVGKHFFDITFAEADYLTSVGKKQFIADLMPRYPVYVNLLAKEAIEVMGKPHVSTQRALGLLQEQGFHFNGYIDIFDGGPTLEAHKSEITVVRHSQTVKLAALAEVVGDASWLISNARIDFRACQAALVLHEDATVTLAPVIAEALQVIVGDKLRICRAHEAR